MDVWRLEAWTITLSHSFPPSTPSVADLEQLYERWLQSQKAGWSEETANSAAKVNGKQIHMPTDDAEEVVSLPSAASLDLFYDD